MTKQTCISHPTPLLGCSQCLAIISSRAEDAERRNSSLIYQRDTAIALVVTLAKMAGVSDVNSGLVVEFLASRYDG